MCAVDAKSIPTKDVQVSGSPTAFPRDEISVESVFNFVNFVDYCKQVGFVGLNAAMAQPR